MRKVVVVVVLGLQASNLHWYGLELGSGQPTPLWSTVPLGGCLVPLLGAQVVFGNRAVGAAHEKHGGALGNSRGGKRTKRMQLQTELTPPPRVQQTILSSKTTVRAGVFVGHAVRCARQDCETVVTHP